MKRKNADVLLAALAAAFVLAGCASMGKTGTLPTEVDASDEVTVDWKGRNVGVEIPAWVRAVATSDPDNVLSSLPRLEGKKAIPMTRNGANLALVESWLNTQAYAQCTQRIRTAVSTNAQNALSGDLATPEAISIVNEFNSLYSQATITGLNKEMDSWVKTRSKSKGTEEYTCYVIYSISDADLKESIAMTLGKVEAKTRQQQDIKKKLEEQMNRLMESVDF